MSLPRYPDSERPQAPVSSEPEMGRLAVTRLGGVTRFLGWLQIVSGIILAASGSLSLMLLNTVVGLGSLIMGVMALRVANQLDLSADIREPVPSHLREALRSLRTYFLTQLAVGLVTMATTAWTVLSTVHR